MQSIFEEVARLKAKLYKKAYNKTKYKCVSFRFDKNLINYDTFKTKLKKKNISISQYFQQCMLDVIEED